MRPCCTTSSSRNPPYLVVLASTSQRIRPQSRSATTPARTCGSSRPWLDSLRAPAMAVGAAKRMQADLEVWRRTAVETWFRSHGVKIVSYYVIGVYAYAQLEGWDALQSIYYLTATATTNGDFSPESAGGRLFSCIYILLGITIVFRGLSPIFDFFLKILDCRVLQPVASMLAAQSDVLLENVEQATYEMEEQVSDLASNLNSSANRWHRSIVPIKLVTRAIVYVRKQARYSRSEVSRASYEAFSRRRMTRRTLARRTIAIDELGGDEQTVDVIAAWSRDSAVHAL